MPGTQWFQLVSWVFERLYREFAWAYDLVAALVSRGLWFAWARACVPHLRGRVLELGSGTGHLQYVLRTCAVAPAGLDASPQMIRITAQRLRRAGRVPRLVRGSGSRLPFGAGSYDTVVATFPAGYIVTPATLAEIRRVLAPGGRLVLVDCARLVGWSPLDVMIALAYRLTGQSGVFAERPEQVPYEPFLRRAGFTVQVHWERVRASEIAVIVSHVQHT